MKRNILLFIFCIGSYSAVLAQSLSGKVTNQDNLPLQDVYLYNSSQAAHTHTNAFGHFQLSNINVGDTLVIAHIGYKTRKEAISAQMFQQEWHIQLEEAPVELDQVTISPKLNSLNQISKINLQTHPVKSSQELLRSVPGLMIGQHAGGGKAEQIFLRGFDIDHGTDINISVDGMPVNMVSHAHGQGYSDLHFLIPETVENIDYGKGPYNANKGNFATAGYVDFHTKERVNNSQVNFEYGKFNTLRTVSMFNLLNTNTQHAYFAGEYYLADGPFSSPQNFNRLNVMTKYTASIKQNQKITLTASHFQSKWDASGQIPQRAVDAGLIDRFGAIDDTEGGKTSRTNFSLKHSKIIDRNTFIQSRAFFTHYNFELYSNFTFSLNDPVNGDQIKQKEDRNLLGLESVFNKNYNFQNFDLNIQAGAGFRYDDVNNNELSHTAHRKTTLSTSALGDIDESHLYAFGNVELTFGKWLINPGTRIDYLQFDYINQLDSVYSNLSESKAIASPKLNIVYAPNSDWQFYLKTGTGFHSNDTRVVVNQSGQDILPAAYGSDLGTIWKPTPRLVVNAALWYLFLEQEFVYVGDEGVVEPSGRTERMGIDAGVHYQLTNWMFLDANLNYAHARSKDDPEGLNYIPLAPEWTSSGGLSFQLPSGFSGGIRYRTVADRPANEDNSIVAKGYFVTDMNLNYQYKNVNFGLVIENLLDTEWNETQFATETRLKDEPNSVEEIHFTPGIPFYIRGKIGFTLK
ncbi:TonB-dependent receptor plug domain-containing protein [Rapidithrix thailandica]|uniref:TonB-dependent receptor plug domain-containing protein n=1 Tax=Rapidithrix thailandica TaxID=413964 RepID=A0AAW9S7E3_9BACT